MINKILLSVIVLALWVAASAIPSSLARMIAEAIGIVMVGVILMPRRRF